MKKKKTEWQAMQDFKREVKKEMPYRALTQDELNRIYIVHRRMQPDLSSLVKIVAIAFIVAAIGSFVAITLVLLKLI